MPNSPSNSSRTPPDLKWLLNERAAIAGEISKSTTRQTALSKRLQQVEHRRDLLECTLSGAVLQMAAHQRTLTALDATISLAYAGVEPSAGGVVKAWAGKYGKRGGLKRFVAKTIQDVAPTPITTTLLINLASKHFGINIEDSWDRKNFRYTVKRALRGLLRNKLIDAIHDRTVSTSGVWRWGQPPSLTDLAAQVTASDSPAHADPAGNKVAGQ